MKLYRVTLGGLRGFSPGTVFGVSYVVAPDPAIAYEMVRKFLDDRRIGFVKDRALDRIELLAEAGEGGACKTMLFLPDAAERGAQSQDLRMERVDLLRALRAAYFMILEHNAGNRAFDDLLELILSLIGNPAKPPEETPA